MDNTFIPKGMELVKQAVIADNANDLTTALSLYKQGLQYFITGMKYVNNERSKEAIRLKVGQYMSRAEELKQALDKRGGNKKKPQVVNAGAVGGPAAMKAENKEGGEDEEAEMDPETAKLQAAISGAIIKSAAAHTHSTRTALLSCRGYASAFADVWSRNSVTGCFAVILGRSRT